MKVEKQIINLYLPLIPRLLVQTGLRRLPVHRSVIVHCSPASARPHRPDQDRKSTPTPPVQVHSTESVVRTRSSRPSWFLGIYFSDCKRKGKHSWERLEPLTSGMGITYSLKSCRVTAIGLESCFTLGSGSESGLTGTCTPRSHSCFHWSTSTGWS